MDQNAHQPEFAMFLASATHDMKNSLGMLSGSLEAMLADPAIKDGPAYQRMAHMLYETRRMNNNLIQLLALYRNIGSTGYPFDPQPQSLQQFAQDVEAQNRILFDSKQISFESDFPPDLVWTFDEDLILGVLGHAINNAIRYTGDRIRLAMSEQDGFLEIRVEDNGEGYPDATLEAGSAVAAGVDFKSSSTGLGLHFAHAVAEMHRHRGRGGSVALENGGKWGGACFVLRLP